MSINIGTPAVEAIRELRGVPQFEHLLDALGAIVQLRLLSACDTEPSLRTHATSHARGMYELWVAMHAAHSGLHQAQVKPPALTVGEEASEPSGSRRTYPKPKPEERAGV
jgi:hypothetical protein